MKRSINATLLSAVLYGSRAFLTICFILFFFPATAQQGPGSVQFDSGQSRGYILFAPKDSTTTFLIDTGGKVVHSWPSSYTPGMAVYLLPNGNLLRAETIRPALVPWPQFMGGQISEYTWDGALLWRYQLDNDTSYQSHDIFPLPNGNVLVGVWDSIPYNVARSMGRNTRLPTDSYLLGGMVVELEPQGTSAKVVWQWRFRDHLDSTGTHANLLNINDTGTPCCGSNDWIHMNAVTYNSSLNQVLVSSRNLNEFFIIDHSTTTAQAAGHSGGRYGQGGDILYRWGNPTAYGMKGPQQLFGQHSPYWLNEGYAEGRQIMVNNDGYGRTFTSANIIKPPVVDGFYLRAPDSAFGPVTDSLVYTADSALYSPMRGNTQLLSNGNLLICAAQVSTFYEVGKARSPGKTRPIIWQYKLADKGGAFRCTHYDAAYPALRYRLGAPKTGKKK